MIGSVLGSKYLIERVLGVGGMGAVYQALHVETQRRVAVKVLNMDQFADAEGVARFKREAVVSGAVDSKHAVQIMDSGTDSETDSPYLVMELLTGEDLQTLVQRVGPLPPDLVTRIAIQACLGIKQAHQASVIHRDIKPANLYLAHKEGEVIVKVLDFGIAKFKKDPMKAENAELTRTGSMMGSPLYMSPEQMRGFKTVDARTDIWSLGIVMYEALTGDPPQAGVETLGEIVFAICSYPTPPVQDRAPWVSPGLAEVLKRATEIDLSLRYQTVDEMLVALRTLVPKDSSIHPDMLLGVSSDQRTVTAPRLPSAATTIANGMTATTGRLVRGRTPIVAVVIGSVLGIVLLGAVVVLARAQSHKQVAAAPTESAPVLPPPLPVQPSATPPLPTASSHRVLVTIAPLTSEVTVDGTKTEIHDGSIAIEGALGSVHIVSVKDAAHAREERVVITESGALPSSIAVGSAKTPHARRDAGASTSGTSKSQPASASTTPNALPGSGIQKGTDEFK